MTNNIGEGRYGLRIIYLHPSMKNHPNRDETFWFHNEVLRDTAYDYKVRDLKGVDVTISKLKRK